MLFARLRKGFLHRTVTGDEKWIHYDNPKKKKSWAPPGHASTSTAKPNCSNRTRSLLGLSTEHIDEIEPSTQGKTRPFQA